VQIVNIRWILEPVQIEGSGMRNMIPVAHRDSKVADHTSAVFEEMMMNTEGPNEVATKRNLIIRTTYHLVKGVLQITKPKGTMVMTAAAVGKLGSKTRLKIDTIH